MYVYVLHNIYLQVQTCFIKLLPRMYRGSMKHPKMPIITRLRMECREEALINISEY